MVITHQEHGINALPLRIPHRAKPIPRDSARHQPRHVPDDEPQRPTARATHKAPERPRRPASPIRHALLAQHLLEHVAELLALGLLPALPLALGLALAREEIPRPRVGVLRAAPGWWRRAELRLGLGLLGGGLLGAGRGVAAALDVVVAAAGGVREGVVCVVDELELAGAGLAVGAGVGDAVRVVF